MKSRLLKIMTAKNLTASNLAKMLMIQPSNVSHILSGRNNPNLQFIQKLLSAFPDLNPRWLINGEEPMFTSENVQQTQESLFPEQILDIHQPEIQPEISIEENCPVQAEQPAGEILNPNPEKKISRIVIFYSDRSFVDYRPE